MKKILPLSLPVLLALPLFVFGQSPSSLTMLQSQVEAVTQECGPPSSPGFSRCAIGTAQRLSSSINPLWQQVTTSQQKKERDLAKQLARLDYNQHPDAFERWAAKNDLSSTPSLASYATSYRALQKLQTDFKSQNPQSCLLTGTTYLDEGCEKFCQLVPNHLEPSGYLCLTPTAWKEKAKQAALAKMPLTHEDQDSESLFGTCQEKWPSGLENNYTPDWSLFQSFVAKSGEFSSEDKQLLTELLKTAVKKPSGAKVSPIAGLYRILRLLQVKAAYEQHIGMPLAFHQMPALCTPYASVFALQPFSEESKFLNRRGYLYSQGRLAELITAARRLKQLVMEEGRSLVGTDPKKQAEISHILFMNNILYGSYHSIEPQLKGLMSAFTVNSTDSFQKENGWFLARHLLEAKNEFEQRRVLEKGYEVLSKQYEQTMGDICNPESTSLYRLEYLLDDEVLSKWANDLFPELAPVQQCLKEQYQSRSTEPQEVVHAAQFVSTLASSFIKGGALYGQALRFISGRMTDETRKECFSATGNAQCTDKLKKILSEEATRDELFEIFSSRSSVGGGGGTVGPRRPRTPRRDQRVNDIVESVERDLNIQPTGYGSIPPSSRGPANFRNGVPGISSISGTVTRVNITEVNEAVFAELGRVIGRRIGSRTTTRLVHIELPDNFDQTQLADFTRRFVADLQERSRQRSSHYVSSFRVTDVTELTLRSGITQAIEDFIERALTATRRIVSSHDRHVEVQLGQNRYTRDRIQMARYLDREPTDVLVVLQPQNFGAEILGRIPDIARENILRTTVIVISSARDR